MTRSISILGATGSIGASTLDLVRRNRDAWRVVALTANGNAADLARLAREFSAEVAVIADEARLAELREALAGTGIAAEGGAQALVDAAARPADMTIAAIVGCAGLAPVMAAIERGGAIGLANKEALVSAGDVMTEMKAGPFDLLGLFQGVGLAQDAAVPETGRLPNMVFLYRRAILDYWAEHDETLGSLVTHVLVHEIGHHFGLSDADMEAIEASVP